MSFSRVRDSIFLALCVFLGLGYAGSQWFWWQGKPTEWAQLIDQPNVKILAAVLVLSTVAVAWQSSKQPEEQAH